MPRKRLEVRLASKRYRSRKREERRSVGMRWYDACREVQHWQFATRWHHCDKNWHQQTLDKSEGVVKTEISWAVREHRLLCQRRLRTKSLEISPESLCGGVVPPTIDST